MAFNNLSDKLQNVFKNLTKKGLLTEEDVKIALKEIKMALLEADVSFNVVKNFIKDIEQKTIGTNVLKGLNPAQSMIKIVNDELVHILGDEEVELDLNNGLNIIMMVGLQGVGKTTTAFKLANKLKNKGKKLLLVACDIYRPAAIEQLKINASKINVDVFEEGLSKKPLEIVLDSLEFAKKNNLNTIIIDTAGRLHIDETMMLELEEIKNNVKIDKTILVVDAMMGQDAVNIAKDFDEKINIDGIILTKMDGDSRGGAALSIKSIINKPIYYVGMGEKMSDLEVFYPKRIASRILGMGDMLTLIDKLQEEANLEDFNEMEDKKDFDLEDFLVSFKQVRKLGGVQSLLDFMPSNKIDLNNVSIDEKKIDRIEAIIFSMTKEERKNPSILNASRKRRIANGSGTSIQEVNILIKNFEQSKKFMKQFQKKSNKGFKFPLI